MATGGNPSDIAVSPDGKSVYVTNFFPDFSVSQYSVGTGDTLAPKTIATVKAGVNPLRIAVAADGKSAYVPISRTTASPNTTSAPVGR